MRRCHFHSIQDDCFVSNLIAMGLVRERQEVPATAGQSGVGEEAPSSTLDQTSPFSSHAVWISASGEVCWRSGVRVSVSVAAGGRGHCAVRQRGNEPACSH